MSITFTKGTWLPIEQLEGFYDVVSLSEIPGTRVKKQTVIISDAKNPADAVLCSFAPNMYECLTLSRGMLSAIADTDETVAKCYRYIDAVLNQIDPPEITDAPF